MLTVVASGLVATSVHVLRLCAGLGIGDGVVLGVDGVCWCDRV